VLDHRPIGCALDLDGLLGEAEEEQTSVTRPAPVAPEREFIQVVVEIGGAHGALMGA
jgi:hypothetical protein